MSERSLKVAILLVLVAVLLSACNTVRGSRDLVTESREVGNFDSVSMGGSGDLIIIQNGEESLTIETDDNLMQYITSEVRGGTLYLGVEESTAIWPSRLIFTVGVDDLTGVEVSGSGDIEADSIETDRLDVGVSGSGDIRLDDLEADDLEAKISGSGSVEMAGQVTTQDINIGGSGKFKGEDLLSETASVTVNGSGKVTIWVTESLDAQVSGSGSIDYYGNPLLNASESGSGNINGKGSK